MIEQIPSEWPVAAENGIREIQAPVYDAVAPGETGSLPPQHPFVVIEEGARYVLEATQNGERIQVSRLVGRLALAMDVGIDHGKTREELFASLYFDKPEYSFVRSTFSMLVARTRVAIEGYAPPLVMDLKHIGDKPVYLYSYEDIAPQSIDRDFEQWDANSTYIRFDKRTNCLTVAQDGVRTSGTVLGPISQKILECLLRQPNEAVYGQVLYDQIRSLKHGQDGVGIGLNMDVLRKWIKKHLKHDPRSLIDVELTSCRKGPLALYTLRADRVEIIEEDGSMCLPCDAVAESAPRQPVDSQSLAILALGLSIQQSHIDRLRKVLPSGILPDAKFLADLGVDTLSGNGSARQLIVDNIDRCLQQFRRLFDSEGAQEAIRNWSPDDSRLKTFLLSLEQFDKLHFNLRGKSVRGIDLLNHLLKPSETK